MFFKKKIMPWEFDNKNLKKSVEKKTKVQLMLEFLDPNASLKILEIGTASGETTTQILEQLIKNEASTLYAFDPFVDYPDKDKRNHESVYDAFMRKNKNAIQNNKLIFKRDYSFNGLINLYCDNHKNTFDLVMIDGDHRARYVLEDFLFSLKLIKKNGYLMFDDYHWFPSIKKNRIEGYKKINSVPKERIPKYAIEFLINLSSDIRYVGAANNYNVLMFQKI